MAAKLLIGGVIIITLTFLFWTAFQQESYMDRHSRTSSGPYTKFSDYENDRLGLNGEKGRKRAAKYKDDMESVRRHQQDALLRQQDALLRQQDALIESALQSYEMNPSQENLRRLDRAVKNRFPQWDGASYYRLRKALEDGIVE